MTKAMPRKAGVSRWTALAGGGVASMCMTPSPIAP